MRRPFGNDDIDRFEGPGGRVIMLEGGVEVQVIPEDERQVPVVPLELRQVMEEMLRKLEEKAERVKQELLHRVVADNEKIAMDANGSPLWITNKGDIVGVFCDEFEDAIRFATEKDMEILKEEFFDE